MQSVKNVAKTMTIALLSSLLIVNISYAADQQRRYEADAAKKQQTIQIFKSAYERTKSENAALTLAHEQNIVENAVATAVESIVTEKQYVNTPEEENATERDSYSKERLPENIETNSFFCEDYRFLNVPGTHQYRLQQECYTEQETGLRYFVADGKRWYCVALGNAYGTDIGDTWVVTLANGENFGIIYADYKHSIEEIDPFDFGDQYDINGNQLRNYDEEPVINVLEFVYDDQTAPREMILAGTMTYFDRFGGLYGDGGNIIKMEYLGRKWEP